MQMFKKGALGALILYVAVSLAEGVSRAAFGRENSLLEMIWRHYLRHVAAFFYAAGDWLMFVIRHIHLEEFFFAFWDTLCLIGRVAMIPCDFVSGMFGISFFEFGIGDWMKFLNVMNHPTPSSVVAISVFAVVAAFLGFMFGNAALQTAHKNPSQQEEPVPPPRRGRKAKTSE